jgi:hypothetical protein
MPKGVFDRKKARKRREAAIEFAKSAGFSNRLAELWYSKYLTLRRNSKHEDRGDLKLSFQQYLKLALRAGLTSPNQIGNRPGKYQLGRIGDNGDYEVGNCRFITFEQNYEEWVSNGGRERSIEKRADYNKDTRPAMAAMAEEYRNRNKRTHEYIAKKAERQSRLFKVKSPDGQTYSGRNLKEFCDEHGLHQGCMHIVCSGHRPHHKNWTGRYTDKG